MSHFINKQFYKDQAELRRLVRELHPTLFELAADNLAALSKAYIDSLPTAEEWADRINKVRKSMIQ